MTAKYFSNVIIAPYRIFHTNHSFLYSWFIPNHLYSGYITRPTSCANYIHHADIPIQSSHKLKSNFYWSSKLNICSRPAKLEDICLEDFNKWSCSDVIYPCPMSFIVHLLSIQYSDRQFNEHKNLFRLPHRQSGQHIRQEERRGKKKGGRETMADRIYRFTYQIHPFTGRIMAYLGLWNVPLIRHGILKIIIIIIIIIVIGLGFDPRHFLKF